MRQKKSMKNQSESEIITTELKNEYLSKEQIDSLISRKFEGGKTYLLKHIKSMIPEDDLQQLPKFWDDKSITNIERNNIEWMVGVEVHLHKHIVALYGRSRQDHRKKYLGPILSIINTPKGFVEFQRELHELNIKPSRFLMETTGVYHFPVVWHLNSVVPEVKVIAMNARSLKEYMPKVSKKDKTDAIRIAQVAQLDDFIKSTYIPDKEEFALRELLRQHGKIMSEKVRYMNVIKKILASAGFSYKFRYDYAWEMDIIKRFLQTNKKFGSAVYHFRNVTFVKKNIKKFDDWRDFNMPDLFKANVLLLFGMLEQTKINLDIVEKALLESIENLNGALKKNIELLKECNGVGILTATGILLETGDIHRFHSASHYLSYCGIAPSEGTSGYIDKNTEEEKKVQSAKPNPRSNHALKRLYVGAAGQILKESKLKRSKNLQPNDMLRYSERYTNEKDRGKNLKNIFKIAAKLARRIYYCIINNRKYDPYNEYEKMKTEQKNGGEISKIPPKRARKAWSLKKMNLLQKDMQELLDQIIEHCPKSVDKTSEMLKYYEIFMKKYKFPDEFRKNVEEVCV